VIAAPQHEGPIPVVDALRSALLSAFQSAEADLLQWLYILLGHSSVLPSFNAVQRDSGFVYARVCRFVTPASALTFLASLQATAIVRLLLLAGWLPLPSEDTVLSAKEDTSLSSVLRTFYESLNSSRFEAELVGSESAFDDELRTLVNSPESAAFCDPCILRARHLLVDGLPMSSAFESAACSVMVGSSAQSMPLRLPSFSRQQISREWKQSVVCAAAERGIIASAPRSILSAISLTRVGAPEAASVDADLLVLRAITNAGGVGHAGYLWLVYLGSLIDRR